MSYNKCVEEDVKTISYLLLSHCLCELLSLYCILSKMVAELGCIFFGASAFQYSYNCTCVHLVVWKWLIKNSECIVNLEQKLQMSSAEDQRIHTVHDSSCICVMSWALMPISTVCCFPFSTRQFLIILVLSFPLVKIYALFQECILTQSEIEKSIFP